MSKHTGTQSVLLQNPPTVLAHACVVGKKEGEGPLADSFDLINEDSSFGEKSWEKAEIIMQQKAFSIALSKADLSPKQINYIFAGDLLNQCIGSSFSLRESGIPFFGLYGACSTMAEALSLAAMSIDGGFAEFSAALTSSHFCSAERQYRFPLEYGGLRTPTAQWTVTGSGAAVLAANGPGPYITRITTGKIIDPGIKDANNMGAAMAPAAYDTLKAHFSDFSVAPSDYDLIVTGDLGNIGCEILTDFFRSDGVELINYNDCGAMIFSQEQDVHAGGSGCGCSASVLCGHILNGIRAGRWDKVLFAATGALLSPTSTQQGESIPGICHAVTISKEAI